MIININGESREMTEDEINKYMGMKTPDDETPLNTDEDK